MDTYCMKIIAKINIKLLILLIISCCQGPYVWGGLATVGFETFTRLSDVPAKTDVRNWITLDYQTKNNWSKSFSYSLDVNSRYFYQVQDYAFSISEIYLMYNFSSGNFTIGRQLLDWNPSESFWELDDLNGKQGLSLLGDKQEGLIGANLNYNFSSGMYVSIFASSIFVPNLNPKYQVQDGLVKSPVEWAYLPPSKFLLKGQLLPIHYDLHKVNTWDILKNKSIGLRLGYKWSSGKVWGYALFKPENRLRFHGDGHLSKKQNYGVVDVLLHPFASSHMLYGIETTQTYKKLTFGAGLAVIDPNGDFKTDLLIIDPVTIATNSHVSFDAEYFKISPIYNRKSYFHSEIAYKKNKYDVSINYLHSLTDNSTKGNFYSNVAKWKRAFGILGNLKITDNFTWMVNWKYDFSRKDNLLKSQVAYKFLKRAIISLGVELLGAPTDHSFWGLSRFNDTVYTSLQYRF
ncbi:MAG: hypothetical protein ISR65_17380 [Bacteriovoracaceae bacterium]|nr:hypothetical protein [Bacteriovoracaceae bacterium]